ncbi:hypothetical protein I33_2462 [Bacillus subtilis subsp. subtilis str. RO-NN-1]|nr:hypothetical protein I33_2462 [Bacillus subtilis subsp. subtilis str. RO-NN-1]
MEYIIRRKKPKMFTSIFGFFTLSQRYNNLFNNKTPKA